MARDVIITGPARSGTTLVCHLLNRLPDTVALHEPMDLRALGALGTAEQVAAEVARFFETSRQSLLAERRAISRHVDGRVPDDPIAADRSRGRPTLRYLLRALKHAGRRPPLRRNLATRGWVTFDRPLTPSLLLAIKHHAGFTALLPILAGAFECYAVVRNPLAVLASWNTVDFALADGRSWVAERIDPTLRRALKALPDRLDRQLHLLEWSFSQYARYLSPERVLRYETIVATGGRALTAISPRATDLAVPLESRNANPLYDRALMNRLGERLLEHEGALWAFYPRDAVVTLLEQLAAAEERAG